MRAFGLTGEKAEIGLRLFRELKGLNERERRSKAADRVGIQEQETGRRDVSLYWRLSGMARSTIARALKERLMEPPQKKTRRVRRPGGGRKRKYDRDPAVMHDLRRLVERTKRGETPRVLQWTTKGLRQLSAMLNERGHSVSPHLVADGLRELGYSLQSVGRRRGVGRNLDRDAQFQYVNALALSFLVKNDPVIMVETSTDVVPASASVHAIRQWWYKTGQARYGEAGGLLITTDIAVSDNRLLRLWQHELRKLANDLRLGLTVCHMPFGTRKWNRVEQRLLFVAELTTLNRDGERTRKIRSTVKTTIQMIGEPKTSSAAMVITELDKNRYAEEYEPIPHTGLARSQRQPHSFNGAWNYDISPE